MPHGGGEKLGRLTVLMESAGGQRAELEWAEDKRVKLAEEAVRVAREQAGIEKLIRELKE